MIGNDAVLQQARRKRQRVIVLATAGACVAIMGMTSLALGLDSSSWGVFTDDDDNVHEGFIEAIAAEGIIRGCNPPTNTRFCPGDTLTRGQLAAVLNRALQLPPPAGDPFTDDDDSIFETDIAAIAAAGIARGCNPPDNTEFCPQAMVTRGQMAAFLVTAFGLDFDAGTDFFIDDDGSLFEPQINRLRAAGIASGCNPPANTMYCPDAPLRRDQMASLLARAVGLASIVPSPWPSTTTTTTPAVTTSTSTTTSISTTTTSTTTTTTSPPPAEVLIGAGDIGGGSSDTFATADLILGFPNATVFTTGDNAYENGTAEDFAVRYDPSWGVFKDRTYPSIGNHDAPTTGAAPYFDYFGANAGIPGKGWYSYNLGSWHLIVLNSECGAAGLASCQEQLAWLESDLAAHPQGCSLAYWHKPLFSSGQYAPGWDTMIHEWSVLDAAGVDVVLNGHDHNYQRYLPQSSGGLAAPTGIREFVVGTGGMSLYGQTTTPPNLEEFYEGYGVLKLDLGQGGYGWTFISTDRSYEDTGADTCGDS